MNSYNHYAFGAVGEWMYEHVTGLDRDPAALAWKRVVIHPVPGGGLTHARASYVSPRGKIVSGWKIKGDRLTLDVEIPVHATARIEVPTPRADAVNERGKLATKAPGVRFVESRAGVAVYDVGAGTYRFEAPMK